MKILLFVMILGIMILPIISADLIVPGTKTISITNTIINIADFPDHYFISICKPPMPQVRSIIKEDGIIGSCYKFSPLSVYAVKKSEFEVSRIDAINAQISKLDQGYNSTDIDNYLKSIRFVEVISDIPHYATAPITSTQDKIENTYQIDPNKLVSKPINTEIKRNNLLYAYIGISAIALIAIAYILLRRKK